jgi:hypothetical protein
MATYASRAALLALAVGLGGTLAACNLTFSQIDFGRIEAQGTPVPSGRYAGGGAYPPVGPGR